MRSFSQVVVILCFLWVGLFLFFGGTPWGKDALTDFASRFFDDKKSGFPIVMLAVPILVAGSVASVGATYSSRVRSAGVLRRANFSRRTFAIGLLFLPCIFYLLACIYRHLYGKEVSKEKKLKELGNSFGMMAMVIMSWLLIPVSHLGSIRFLFAFEPNTWVFIHIWSGRLVVAGALMHGAFHTMRWMDLGESVMAMVLPPISCWTDGSFEPICNNHKTDCTCYYLWRNFLGVMASTGLLVIGVSSVYQVRRWNFPIFAMIHRITAPLVYLAFIMHYNRGVLYIAGGLLYFLAGTFPIWIEQFRQRPVKITSIQKLECRTNPCVSLSIEATQRAIERFRPGVFCYLRVPGLSKVSHPFTVNPVPGRSEMRLIFRASGPFTRALESQLSIHDTDMTAYLHGYYGSVCRVNQLMNHDVTVIVAAGIGITPYLSLLSDFASRTDFPDSTRQRNIVLHWICRDASLVDYCYREYFADLHWPESRNLSMTLVIHKTGSDDSDGVSPSNQVHYADDEETDRADDVLEDETEDETADLNSPGAPFSPSAFTVSDRIQGNWAYFLVFAATAWLGIGLIWHCYQNLQSKHEVKGRVYTSVLLGFLGLVIAGIANVCYDKMNSRNDDISWNLVSSKDTIDAESDSPVSSIELTTQVSPAVPDAHDDLGDGGIEHNLTMQESIGRPAVEDLIAPIRDAACPALFCCVPAELLAQLQGAVQEEIPSTALYVEVFEV